MFIVLINNCMATFRGLSTVDKVRAPYSLLDQELVKRDLLNEFYTRRGERVMRPNFGSIIWDVLMDPASKDLEKEIRDDVRRIIDRDPRVELLQTTVYLLDHTLRVEINLRFAFFDNTDKLYLEYTRDIAEGADL